MTSLGDDGEYGRRGDGPRVTVSPRRRAALLYSVLAVLAALVVLASLRTGTGDLADAGLRDTFLSLRAARLGAALLAGGALAMGGVMVQGLFRNPLASPSILGTTGGAHLGGMIALLLCDYAFRGGSPVPASLARPELWVPIGSLVGAMLALGILLVFLRVTEDLLALLLTGFVLSALFLSLAGLVTSLAQEQWELGRAIVAYSLGSVSATSAPQLLFAFPLLVIGGVASWCWGRPLDLLLSGEDEARAMGVDVPMVRRWTAVWVSVLVAAAISVGGNLGFVGLIVPHALRPFSGVAHRRLLPAAFVAGAIFVAFADVLTRVVPARGEVPLGVVTSLIGAPVFVIILLRMRREEADA